MNHTKNKKEKKNLPFELTVMLDESVLEDDQDFFFFGIISNRVICNENLWEVDTSK